MNIIKILSDMTSQPLSKRKKISTIIRFVKWQLGSRINPYPIVYDFIGDTRLIITKGQTSLTGNLYNGMTSFEPMSFILHYLRQGENVIDVGANAGIFTILAAGVKKANVIAIEPIPETFSHLIDNLAINYLFEKVTPKRVGIGDNQDKISFTSDLGAMNRALCQNELNKAGHTIEVEVTTLDAIATDFNPNLIKIDVEGYENFVIQGGEKTLSRSQCNVVILELNGNGKKFGISDESIHNKMLGFNFSPYRYDPFRRKLEILDFNEREEDIIYIKNYELAVKRITEAEMFKVFGYEI